VQLVPGKTEGLGLVLYMLVVSFATVVRLFLTLMGVYMTGALSETWIIR